MPAFGAGMMVNRAVPAQDPAADQRRERAHRRDRYPVRAGRDRWRGYRRARRQHRAGAAAAELALGLLIGAAVGGGGWLVKMARGRGWVAEGFAGRNRAFDGGLGVKGRSWSPPLLITP
jgi:hypothetical protein